MESGRGHGEWEGPWRVGGTTDSGRGHGVTSAQLCQLPPKGGAQEATCRCLGANHFVLS